jgi:hypothetical protein
MQLRLLPVTALLVLFVAAGCQPTQLVAPPPTFEAPRMVAPRTMLPPSQDPTPTKNPKPTPTRPPVQSVAGAPPVTGGSLIPKVKPRPWAYIVVHHSDTPTGCKARFNAAHIARGWEMLGYDFVIGNGTESGDGEIEVGPRWPIQMTGAHTGTPDHLYNDTGIGICLVGNLQANRPTSAQVESLARLCAYFMKTYHIPAKNIIGHRDCKSTECPGDIMYALLPRIRQMATAYAQQK